MLFCLDYGKMYCGIDVKFTLRCGKSLFYLDINLSKTSIPTYFHLFIFFIFCYILNYHIVNILKVMQ